MKKTLLALGFGVWRQYQNDQVAIEAAALAYYLLFSFFPLLIFISSLLGAAHLLQETVLSNLQGILPGEVLELVQGYLQQINQETTKNILMVSLFFSVYFPFRAMSRVIRVINQAYQVCKDRSILSKLILILVFGVFLAVLVFGSLFLTVMGRTILEFAAQYLPINATFIEVWAPLRFLLLALLTFLVVEFLYVAVPDCKVTLKEAVPGALFTVGLWLGFSAGFSFYVEHFASYSVLYGSVGTIVVLLVWLYAVAMILILGAEINGVLKKIREGRRIV